MFYLISFQFRVSVFYTTTNNIRGCVFHFYKEKIISIIFLIQDRGHISDHISSLPATRFCIRGFSMHGCTSFGLISQSQVSPATRNLLMALCNPNLSMPRLDYASTRRTRAMSLLLQCLYSKHKVLGLIAG